MIFLTIGDSPETRNCTQDLAEKFNAKCRIRFDDKFPFRVARKEHFDEVVFLSHSDTEKLADYTPQKFVDRFHKEFERQIGKLSEDKLWVKHIHLIGCEVGMWKDGTCLAQKIADLLYNNGYTEALVHAVASPPGVKPHEMRVKVITNPGARLNSANGDVEAYWLTKEQANKLKEIEATRLHYQPKARNNVKEKDKKSPRQLAREAAQEEIAFFDKLRQDGQYFLYTRDIRSELLTKQNTFYSPKKKLKEDPEKNKAIAAINKQIGHLGAKDIKDVKIKHLELLKQKIEKDLSDNWKRHVLETLKYFEKNYYKGYFFKKKNSTTCKVLEAISKSNWAESEEISTKQSAHNQKSSNRSNEKKADTSSSAVDKVAKPLLSKRARAGERHSQGIANLKPTENSDCNLIKIKIRTYIETLESEAKSHCSFSFFGHLGKYKLAKFSKLEGEIKHLRSVEEIRNKVKELYDSSWFLTSGQSHRAKNLIAYILNDQHEREIQQHKTKTL